MRNKHFRKLMYMALVATLTVSPVSYAASMQDQYLSTVATETEAVSILSAYGDQETACVTWNKVENATGYNVYYKASSEPNSSYVQLDTELIREYSSYMRADVLGLKEGSYTIRIVPIMDGKEEISKQATTSTISVKAHTREGFAFSKLSPMGTGSGGYNDDGTVAKDAQIIYISAENVNTVTLDVITNSKGSKTTCKGLVDILSKRQKGYDKRPLIIRMIGTIDGSDINGLNSSGYVQIKGSYNTTLEGVGEDATIRGWGLLIRDSHNVEIRNLGFMLFPDDAISLDTNNENIWVHNNDIFYGAAGSDADQAKGDGSADVKGFSNYVTISYNHFFDSGKSSLCGMSDTKEFFVTYHHNWFDHSDSRHPRIRVGTVHIYNNYFDGNAKYGVGVTKGSSAFVEANVFRNCKYPMLTSLQGSDVAGNSKGNFSGEAGGMIKAYNNAITGGKLVYQTAHETQFDAYLATSRDEVVPTSYQSVSGGNTYNNFDTSSDMYAYTPDDPSNVKSMVTTYAGRVGGGDFSWIFTSADDTDYSVNKALMQAIRSYESDLVSIGGNSIPGSVTDEEEKDDIITDEENKDNVDTEEKDDVTTDEENKDNVDTEEKDDVTTDEENKDNVDTEEKDDVTTDEENKDNVDTEEKDDVTTDEENKDNVDTEEKDDVTTDEENKDNVDTEEKDDMTTDEEDKEEIVLPTTVAHNFTVDGLKSDFFTIKGNTSASKGTVVYDGLTLTTCLKIESSTKIAFETTKASTLTLVLSSNFNKSILIDGKNYTAQNGMVTVELDAGSHTITKGDPANLYYIALS